MTTYIDATTLSLETDGVQVIRDVLNMSELLYLRKTMWEYLSHLTSQLDTPIVQDDPKTYKSFFDLYPNHGMLLQHWEVGHNPMSWFVRQHKNVIAAFQDIWKSKDLLVSFDGLSISLPCEDTKRGWYRNRTWFHTDQSYVRHKFECVQGFVNLYDVQEYDATLRVLRGSHIYHKEFRDTFSITNKADWYKLSPEQQIFYSYRGCEDICIKAPAGSLVLWDSRTIHQGMQPQKERKDKNVRCALYVCMTPKSWATGTQLIKKRKAFLERRNTTHYPHKVILFPKTPRTYGGSLPAVQSYPLVETDLMRKLSGF
jgi:ectoine hydroxylase-related dioxygenase (phytanoyl-CoA dioxygenase family)